MSRLRYKGDNRADNSFLNKRGSKSYALGKTKELSLLPPSPGTLYVSGY